MPILHYLAYGSNLHPLRLRARVPSARVIGVVEIPGSKLEFHKRSVDGSGKCLMYAGGEASDLMYGALYEFSSQEKTALDKAEGKGSGYHEQLLQFSLNGQTYNPFVYVAQSTHIDSNLAPYHWYKNLVVAGARYHCFPPSYIAAIEAVASIADPDEKRTKENERLLSQMEPG